MNEELVSVLTALVGALAEQNAGGACGGCCDCTTIRSFEHQAARANEQSAFAAAESQKNFVQNQQAQFAHLLQMQNDFRTRAES